MPAGQIEQAIHGDKHAMRRQFEGIEADIRALQVTAGLVGANSDSQTPVNPVPAQALLQVAPATAGWLTASVTNPQFIRSTTPGQKRGNLARSPMVHNLAYSADPTFSTGVTELPTSVQTHYQIPTGGQKLYFKLQSSVDGVNFTAPQHTGPHTA